MGCCFSGLNFKNANVVCLENQSNDLVVFTYSMGEVVVMPGNQQRVTVLMKNESFGVMNKNRQYISGVSVVADATMTCRPDYICITPSMQVITRQRSEESSENDRLITRV